MWTASSSSVGVLLPLVALVLVGHVRAANPTGTESWTSAELSAYLNNISNAAINKPLIASCKPEGTLECPTYVPFDSETPTTEMACKDSEMSKTLKYFMYTRNKDMRKNPEWRGGNCVPFIGKDYGGDDWKNAERTAVGIVFYKKGGEVHRRRGVGRRISGKHPGLNENEYVLTKPFVAHPDRICKWCGVWGMKRTVCLRSSNITSPTCHVHKQGYCVNCINLKDESGERVWTGGKRPFKTRQQVAGTQKALEEFLKKCVAAAYDAEGEIKEDFRCFNGTKNPLMRRRTGDWRYTKREKVDGKWVGGNKKSTDQEIADRYIMMM